MKTSLPPTSSSYEDITFLGCYLALKARKEKYEAFAFEKFKKILSNVCEDCRRWKMINEETLKPLGLENEINNPRIENLINEGDNEFLFASTGRIYDLGSKEIIPCKDRRYFLLVTICLNNFSDTHIKKLLAHQLSIYPDKSEFLEQLKLTVREHSKKVIAKSKAQTVIEWIEKQARQFEIQNNGTIDLPVGNVSDEKRTIGRSTPQGNEYILLDVDYILKVHVALKKYFRPEDHDELLGILKEEIRMGDLLFGSIGNRFLYLFRMLFDNGKIGQKNKRVIQRWICRHFRYLKDGVDSPFIKTEVYKVLTGRDYYIPEDGSRIEIEGLEYQGDLKNK